MAPDPQTASMWTPIAVVNLIALFLSPVIAVIVSLLYQHVVERRRIRRQLLSALMATRKHMISDEHARALNLIDVTFHNDTDVRSLWREYYSMLGNAGLNNPVGWKQREVKFNELLTVMAKATGFSNTITSADIERSYVSEGAVNEKQRAEELAVELIRVLKATESLHITTVSPSTPHPFGKPKP